MKKKILTKTTLKQLEKRPIIIFATILLAIIGAIQSFTWLYDRFLGSYKDPYVFEKSIFKNVSPGNSAKHIVSYLGEPRKIEKINDTEIQLWDFKELTIGAVINKENDTIKTLTAYTSTCSFDIFIPQLGFTLCRDYMPDYYTSIEWDAFLGAQSGGYIEKQTSGRYSRYLIPYYGSDINAVPLIQYINDESAYFDELEIKRLEENNPYMKKIIDYRTNIKPNFILITEDDLQAEEALWSYYTTLWNFNWFN